MQSLLPGWRPDTPLTPRYLVAAILLLLGVVGILGLLAASKARNSLTSVLMEEGTALTETLEVSSRNALVANRLLEQSIARRLLDNARLIDRIVQENVEAVYGGQSSIEDAVNRMANEINALLG